MKRKSIIAVLVAMTMVLSSSMMILGSQKSNMELVLKNCQKGNYKTARKYNKKLPKYANEKCVKKMNSKMKKAYENKVKKMASKAISHFYTDIDNDKKAELLVLTGTCEADMTIKVFDYKNKKVKYITSFEAGHSTIHAYPGHKGVVQNICQMGYQQIAVITIKKGKIDRKIISENEPKNANYINIGLQLK